MRLIDADNFIAVMNRAWEEGELTNGEWIKIREAIKDEPTVNSIVHCDKKGEWIWKERTQKHTETHACDCISRQAAIEALKALEKKPKALEDDYDFGRRQMLETCMDIIQDLQPSPSAQPERKREKWIITDAYPHNVYCSNCYKKYAQTHWAVWRDGSLPRDFCPNCGAEMGGK